MRDCNLLGLLAHVWTMCRTVEWRLSGSVVGLA